MGTPHSGDIWLRANATITILVSKLESLIIMC